MFNAIMIIVRSEYNLLRGLLVQSNTNAARRPASTVELYMRLVCFIISTGPIRAAALLSPIM